MVVTQENLIKQIADNEDIDVATVRKVFKSAENCVFAFLSSATPSEHVMVKILNGLSMECKYIPQKKICTYSDITCAPRIWVKPKITRYYNRKLNECFGENED